MTLQASPVRIYSAYLATIDTHHLYLFFLLVVTDTTQVGDSTEEIEELECGYGDTVSDDLTEKEAESFFGIVTVHQYQLAI